MSLLGDNCHSSLKEKQKFERLGALAPMTRHKGSKYLSANTGKFYKFLGSSLSLCHYSVLLLDDASSSKPWFTQPFGKANKGCLGGHKIIVYCYIIVTCYRST